MNNEERALAYAQDIARPGLSKASPSEKAAPCLFDDDTRRMPASEEQQMNNEERALAYAQDIARLT